MNHQQGQEEKQRLIQRRRKPLTIAVLAIMLVVCMICAIAAYAAEPGSNDDPIALKSYVDTKLSALESKLSGDWAGAGTGSADAGMEEKLEALTKRVDALVAENEALKRAIRQTVFAAARRHKHQ